MWDPRRGPSAARAAPTTQGGMPHCGLGPTSDSPKETSSRPVGSSPVKCCLTHPQTRFPLPPLPTHAYLFLGFLSPPSCSPCAGWL